MKFFNLVAGALAALVPVAQAVNFIAADSLIQCGDNTKLSVTKFSVLFTPNNKTLEVGFEGSTAISGKVDMQVDLIVYGYKALTEHLDPCGSKDLAGLCPMSPGDLDLKSAKISVSKDVLGKIPSIAFNVPDLDARVRITVNDKKSGDSIACVETQLSNSKSVYQVGVSWTVAVITGLGIIMSAVYSVLGHSQTATHVAFSSISFLTFMQAQAMVGMMSVHMPPIVQAWTQNFQWSMGIIHLESLQTLCTWFQRATGGTPSTLLSDLSHTSVIVQKRSTILSRALGGLMRRADEGTGQVTVRGIERVGFRASIEPSNVFMTGYFFYYFIVVVILICALLTKLVWKLLSKKRHLPVQLTAGWTTLTRGTLFRLMFVGYTQMCVLCLWELTHQDSGAEMALAISMWLLTSLALGWATFKIFQRAKRSISMHNSPAYTLYSDPTCFNNWGFLYINYRATAYYFIVPMLIYTIIKGMVIAFGQSAPVAQVALNLVLEAIMLIGISVIRPFMDKGTNIYGIASAAINFVNSVFLLIFSNAFKQPALMTGIMGVIFFVYNAVFAIVILIWILLGVYHAIRLKEPDSRYQPINDDRNSFMRSGDQMTTELDALGKSARGDLRFQSLGDGDDWSPAREKTGWSNNSDPYNHSNNSNYSSSNGPHTMAGARSQTDIVDLSVPLVPSGHNQYDARYQQQSPYQAQQPHRMF
ncbi:transient receptor potential ion channel family protein [Aspergillus melleus]|uniref:transient receptor potential ion channel family protein n=1 Tax=Aspergillus melleus TaxID=138277 RepID=UPI001E8CE2E8|nr:putative flavin carrier protein 3 [Aspergillus melleus]KAH8432351.1 putative flavin carrier protein 3 [Aspergillus melleus]